MPGNTGKEWSRILKPFRLRVPSVAYTCLRNDLSPVDIIADSMAQIGIGGSLLVW